MVSPGVQQEITVKVPDGVVPGETKLKCRPTDGKEGYDLIVLVPPDAEPGDLLVMREDGTGEWACTMQKPRTPGAAVAQDVGRNEDGRPTFEVVVPASAQPGETKLRVHVEEEELLIPVPESALPGDCLQLQQAEQGSWQAKIVRGKRPPRRANQDVSTIALTLWSVDLDACFARTVEVAREAGAFVSPKLLRAGPPRLPIAGMMTTGVIEEGELLMRIPAACHISESTCRKILPRLYSAVSTLSSLSEGRRSESAIASCIATLLWAAANDSDLSWAPRLWRLYAEALLGVNFELHPHWRALKDFKDLTGLLGPSGEAEYAQMIAGDAMAIYGHITRDVPVEDFGCGFDPGLFLQARLNIMSRSFGTVYDTALVPVIDFCNHSASAGAKQSWDTENDALVLRATRRHEAGEEVCISYGPLTNPTLFRTYGFTMPSEEEPAWSLSCQVSELEDLCKNAGESSGLGPGPASALAESFLPLAEFHLDTRKVTETLGQALDACADGGGDALAMLAELCRRRIESYEEAPAMAGVREALRAARAADSQSLSWWEHLPAGALEGREPCGLRVMASEYLCLLAHREAVDVVAGRLGEEQCFARTSGLRAALSSAAGKRRDGGRFGDAVEVPRLLGRAVVVQEKQ